MIPVKANLSMTNVGIVLLLKNPDDPRSLPIFIAAPEAQAIAVRLRNVELPRPLTHDLLKNILDVFEARLDRVEVHNFVERTFYGRLILVYEGRNIEVDSRPSDAVALALVCGADILVDEDVMEAAGIVLDQNEDATKAAPHRPESRIEGLKAELAKAVEAERYEQAAVIRDRIKALEATESN